LNTIPIALFNTEQDNRPQESAYSWPDLVRLLSRHTTRTTKEGLPAWSPTQYGARKHRNKANVEAITALVLDFDTGIDPDVFKRGWTPYEYMVHSSFSHCEGFAKWRAVFPLATPILSSEWARVYAKLAHNLGRGHTDKVCKDLCRIYFLPCCPPERRGMVFARRNEGQWIDHRTLPDLEIQVPPSDSGKDNKPSGSRKLGEGSKIDFADVAYGRIPHGIRHDTLIRAIYRARRENWDKQAIDVIIESFHNHASDFGNRSREESLAWYLGDIDKVWREVLPDEKWTAKGAVVV
jgi:hypothetical protein